MGRKDRLKEVYEYVRGHFPIHTQADFAGALNYNRAYLSSAMNGNEKNLTDKLFTNICEVFPNVFNIDYLLTGKGKLLANDQQIKIEETMAAASPSDYREKYIESLEKQIKDKDQQIADLRRDIQLLYKRLNIESRYESMQANLFGGIAADELPEPAHDND